MSTQTGKAILFLLPVCPHILFLFGTCFSCFLALLKGIWLATASNAVWRLSCETLSWIFARWTSKILASKGSSQLFFTFIFLAVVPFAGEGTLGKEARVSQRDWHTAAFCWHFPLSAPLVFVQRSNFSRTAVSSSVRTILVFLSPLAAASLHRLSPAERKAELVVLESLGFLNVITAYLFSHHSYLPLSFASVVTFPPRLNQIQHFYNISRVAFFLAVIKLRSFMAEFQRKNN